MDFYQLLRDEKAKYAKAEMSLNVDHDSGSKPSHNIDNLSVSSNDEKSLTTTDNKNENFHSSLHNHSDFKASFEFMTVDLNLFRVGNVPNVYYIPNFINPQIELELLNLITTAGNSNKNVWKQLRTRRLQCWGKVIPPKGTKLNTNNTNSNNDEFKLPPWLESLSDAMVKSSVFENHQRPNHVLINEYQSDEGILHHTDGPAYMDKVAIISLKSTCIMSFIPRNRLESSIGVTETSIEKYDRDTTCSLHQNGFSVVLQPCSLLVFSDQVYSNWMHGIADGLTNETVFGDENNSSKSSHQTTAESGGSLACINTDLAGVVAGEKVRLFQQLRITYICILFASFATCFRTYFDIFPD